MNEFKKGDKVKCIDSGLTEFDYSDLYSDFSHTDYHESLVGKEFIIERHYPENGDYIWKATNGQCFKDYQLELVQEGNIIAPTELEQFMEYVANYSTDREDVAKFIHMYQKIISDYKGGV